MFLPLLLFSYFGASSACKSTCPFVWRPVCGTDGVTYANFCFLRVSACKGGIKVSLKHRGTCQGEKMGKSVDSPVSKVKRQGGECGCPIICTMEYMPMCGSDGQTYGNECVMNAAICHSKCAGGNLQLASLGACAQKREELQKEEVRRQSCDCPLFCTMEYMPMCGSDGQTYGNRCMMDAAICESKCVGGNLELQATGACAKKREEPKLVQVKRQAVSCGCPLFCTMEYEPMCGTDGITYGNRCAMNAAICESKCAGGNLELASTGHCAKKREELEERQEDSCGCPVICTYEYFPLCGSDGQTYGNQCSLDAAICRAKCKGETLELASEGACS